VPWPKLWNTMSSCADTVHQPCGEKLSTFRSWQNTFVWDTCYKSKLVYCIGLQNYGHWHSTVFWKQSWNHQLWSIHQSLISSVSGHWNLKIVLLTEIRWWPHSLQKEGWAWSPNYADPFCGGAWNEPTGTPALAKRRWQGCWGWRSADWF